MRDIGLVKNDEPLARHNTQGKEIKDGDDIITVTEDEIRTALGRIVRDSRIVAEPSGAVTFAGWLFHRDELPASTKTVAIVSGGNIEPHLLAQILAEDVAAE